MMAAGDKQSGFTLIELLVTLAVAIVLATVAVPNFQSLLEKNRLSADVNQVLTGLHYARSEAVKRRENISVQLTGTWQMVVQDGDGVTLKVIESQGGGISATPASYSVTFNALGRRVACASPCSISLTYPGGTEAKSVAVNPAGNILR